MTGVNVPSSSYAPPPPPPPMLPHFVVITSHLHSLDQQLRDCIKLKLRCYISIFHIIFRCCFFLQEGDIMIPFSRGKRMLELSQKATEQKRRKQESTLHVEQNIEERPHAATPTLDISTSQFIDVRGGWGHPSLDNNNLLYRHHRRDCTVKQRAIHTHTRSHARTRTNVDHYTTDLQHKHSTVRATSGRHHPKLHRKQG